MDKRYQIFVSSTYTDLVEERQRVFRAILKIGDVPLGMEFFPAASGMPWNLIEREIKRSDYYVLIIGGRYGSSSKDNDLSFTEREFDLAKATGVPILAFVHGKPDEIPVGKTDGNDAAKIKLDAFRKKVQSSETTHEYLNGDQLALEVVSGLGNAKNIDPRPGLIRGDYAADPALEAEARELRIKVERLTAELQRTNREGPIGSSEFEFENEVPNLSYVFSLETGTRTSGIRNRPGSGELEQLTKFNLPWSDFFKLLGALALTPVSEMRLRECLEDAQLDALRATEDRNFREIKSVRITDFTMNHILLQFMAKGLWEVLDPVEAGGPSLWKLTAYGKSTLVGLVARKKKVTHSE